MAADILLLMIIGALAAIVAWAGLSGRHHPACKPERKDGDWK